MNRFLQANCPVCQAKTHSLDWHIRVFHPVYFDEQLKQPLVSAVQEEFPVGDGNAAAIIAIQME
jgi:hypothetical protein